MTNTNSNAWIFQSWVAFVVALAGSSIGIAYLPLDAWAKAFVALAYFFTVAQAFTLAKTLRDQAETRARVETRGSERVYG
ncbi:MAG: hypothetical protein J0L92_31435 [Deltaproteobacteria bacterium]|nr:hypothetical protein [Deltaproteobacteria bacterium]